MLNGKKKKYKVILTQEGARKYQLNFLAFDHIPYEDFHLWDTVKESRPGKGRDVIYIARLSKPQLKTITTVLGSYIVSVDEIKES